MTYNRINTEVLPKRKAEDRMTQNVTNLNNAIEKFVNSEAIVNSEAKIVLDNTNTDKTQAKDLLAAIDFTAPTFVQLKDANGHYPDFYSSALEKLAEATDLEVDVKWTIDKDNNTIIRDARDASEPEKDSDYCKLSRLFNAARAADRMLRMCSSNGGKIMNDDDINQVKLTKTSPDSEEQNAHAKITATYPLAKNRRINNIKYKLQEIVNNFKNHRSGEIISDEEFNKFLVNILKRDSDVSEDMKMNTELNKIEDQILKNLNTMKDLGGLEDKKYNICTIFNQKDDDGTDQEAFISEAIIPPLPDDYNGLFKIDNPEDGIENSIVEANSQKKLYNGWGVNAYWGALEAQETIPTQNLKTLPGLRNAYVQQIGVIKDQSVKILGKTIHTGTLSSGIKGQDKSNKIAKMNVEHLAKMNKIMNGEDAKLTITSLNSAQKTYFGNLGREDEKRAIKQLTKAVKNVDAVNRAVTPMNNMRYLLDSQLKAYDDTLKSLGEVLEKTSKSLSDNESKAYKEVASYLKGSWSKSDTSAMRAVEKIKDANTKKILKLAIETKKSMKKSLYTYFTKSFTYIPILGLPIAAILRSPTALKKTVNTSQERTVNMMLLSTLVNENLQDLKLSDNNYRMRDIASHCKSGKDRTGGILIAFEKKLLQLNFGKENQKENIKYQINSGHVQRLAGWLGGGTPGADGLKGHSGLTGEKFTPHLKNISLKSAKHNKIKKSGILIALKKKLIALKKKVSKFNYGKKNQKENIKHQINSGQGLRGGGTPGADGLGHSGSTASQTVEIRNSQMENASEKGSENKSQSYSEKELIGCAVSVDIDTIIQQRSFSIPQKNASKTNEFIKQPIQIKNETNKSITNTQDCDESASLVFRHNQDCDESAKLVFGHDAIGETLENILKDAQKRQDAEVNKIYKTVKGAQKNKSTTTKTQSERNKKTVLGNRHSNSKVCIDRS